MSLLSRWLTILVLLVLLCGCESGDVSPPKPTYRNEIVFAVPRDYTGTYRSLAQKFSDASTTTRVRLLEMGDNSSEVHRMLSSILLGNEFEIDVCIIEDVWKEEFVQKGYLMPLDSFFWPDMDAYPAPIASFAQKEGELFALPLEQDVGIIYYRNDLTDDSFHFEEMMEAENTFAVHNADVGDIINNVLTMVQVKGSVEEGLALYKELAENWSDDQTFSDFKNGSLMYALSYTSKHRELISGFSNIRAKVGVTPLERDDQSSVALAKVYGAAVSKKSTNASSVKEFLNYLAQDKIALELLKGRGTVPVKTKHFDNELVLDYTLANKKLKPLANDFYYRRQADDYVLLSRTALERIETYLTDESGLEAAVAAVEELMDDKNN